MVVGRYLHAIVDLAVAKIRFLQTEVEEEIPASIVGFDSDAGRSIEAEEVVRGQGRAQACAPH
jgi:hypothetical protein